jgi:hypothetical protein
MTDAITATNSSLAQERTSIVTSRRSCWCFARLEGAKLTEVTRTSVDRRRRLQKFAFPPRCYPSYEGRCADSCPSSSYFCQP